MQVTKKIFLLFHCIIFSEIKSFLDKIYYINYFLKNINLLKYIGFIFYRNKINPFKSLSFQRYIIENKKKWHKLKFETNSNEKILVENFINQAAYGMSNAIISKFLSKINNNEIIGFIRDGDLKSEIIFRSFGIQKFIKLKKKNIYQRLKYNILAFIKILKINSINDYCKIQIKNIDIGLPAYDSFIRYTGIPTAKEMSSDLIFFLAETLYVYDKFEEVIKKDRSIKHLIQSETAFVPLNIFFQVSLKNSIKVYSRLGTDKFSIRRYDNSNQRYFYRANISQKLLDEVHNNFSKKCNTDIQKYYKGLQKKGYFGQDLRIRAKLKKRLKLISKDEILKRFNWSHQKKIVVFFLNHLIDVNFHSGPRTIFKDNYTWTNFLLNKIKSIKNVNWILKDHPSQPFYKSKLNFEKEIKSLTKKFSHINYFNLEWDAASLKKIADLAITSHGTVGVEYPSFGIDSLYVENSFYSNVDIKKKISNMNELNKKLKKLDKTKRVKSKICRKANSFLYIRYILLQNKCSIIPSHDTSRQIDENKYWQNSTNLIKKFSFGNDEFYKMFKIQLKYNMRHTVNFNQLNLKKIYYNDLSENC